MASLSIHANTCTRGRNIIIIIIIINDSIYPAVSKASRTGNKVSCQPNVCVTCVLQVQVCLITASTLATLLCTPDIEAWRAVNRKWNCAILLSECRRLGSTVDSRRPRCVLILTLLFTAASVTPAAAAAAAHLDCLYTESCVHKHRHISDMYGSGVYTLLIYISVCRCLLHTSKQASSSQYD